MDPWFQMLFSPMMNLRLPSSGDVRMNYMPWTNWGKANARAGNPLMEDEIFREVALPGKQLGQLMKAVEAIVEVIKEQDPDSYKIHSNAFSELNTMSQDIQRKKQDLKNALKTQARDCLATLRRADRDAFETLLDEIGAEQEPSL